MELGADRILIRGQEPGLFPTSDDLLAFVKKPECGTNYQKELKKSHFRMMLEQMCRQPSSIWFKKYGACSDKLQVPDLKPIFKLGTKPVGFEVIV